MSRKKGNNSQVSMNSLSTMDQVNPITRNKVTIKKLINFEKKVTNQVKVSVVVPVCNVEIYLRECLDSIINQTLREIEIICVNDGSKDSSLDILMEYANADTRVKIIDKENAGYGHTMNIGMDMAVGEYIGIVESDDYIDLHMYEDLYNIAKENMLDFVKADFNRFYGKDETLVKVYNKIARADSNYNVLINPQEDAQSFRFIVNTWSGIYCKDFLQANNVRHNETPGASFQDNGFWFQTFTSATRTMYINKPYYMNRRDNPNSSVHNKEKVYCANTEYALMRQYLKDAPEKENRFLALYYVKMYHTYLFTVERVGDEFKKEFLSVFAEEFNKANQAGELAMSEFTPSEWSNLNWIMRDYEEYYYNVVKKAVKVSVVLPVYNVAEFLPQCLDSLIAQSLLAIEIICINDGSTDNSGEILERYALNDTRIKIYSQENKGAGAARNLGLSVANGEYLSFLDADDFFDRRLLQDSYEKAIIQNADICIYESKQYDNETKKMSDCKFSIRKSQLPSKTPFSGMSIKSNPFVSIMGWAWDKLYKRSFVLNNELQFQEQRTTNDMYFVFASILKATRISILEKPLYIQRRNVKSSLSATRELSWECFYYALKKVKATLVEMGLFERYERHFVNYALHSCMWNFNSLPEPTKYKLFCVLRSDWFDDLGVSGRNNDYFDNQQEYKQYLDIVDTTTTEVDDYAYFHYCNTELLRENERLLSKLDHEKIRVSESEVLTLNQILEKLKWNREQKTKWEKTAKELQSKVNSLQKTISQGTKLNDYTRIAQCQRETDFYRTELDKTRASLSFRIAMFITYIPRKIRELVKKN